MFSREASNPSRKMFMISISPMFLNHTQEDYDDAALAATPQINTDVILTNIPSTIL